MMRLAIALGVVILLSGCGLLPEVSHQPTLHNPFPQLTRVAVAPFFNLSAEASVDGRQFGQAYYSELQAIPGFQVVPIGVVETAIHDNHIALNSPAEVRRLAQLLQVDAVVLGAVTDYSPYYPPRCAMQVEWYTANPGYHPIPPGYGLPWGTPAEEDIPQSIVQETELEFARQQLMTQAPKCSAEAPAPLPARRKDGSVIIAGNSDGNATSNGSSALTQALSQREREVRASQATPQNSAAQRANATVVAADTSRTASQALPPLPKPDDRGSAGALSPDRSVLVGGPEILGPGLPTDWPDPRGLIPPPPSCRRPDCHPTDQPVLRHVRAYSGTDPEFTAALSNYAEYRDDARFGGWPAYLQRSEDFIRFCCHKHIAEMLTARGGAGQTKVVFRWPESR
jgi:hypothetical protein